MDRLLLISLLALTGCKNTSKGTPLDVEAAKTIAFDKANDGKRYTIVGYPSISSDVWSTSGRQNTVSVNFMTEPGGEGETVLALAVPLCTGSDCVHVPDSFGPEDLVLYDHGGNKLDYDAKAAVSFTLDLITDKEPMNATVWGKDEKGRPTTRPGKMYFHSHEDIRIDPAG